MQDGRRWSAAALPPEAAPPVGNFSPAAIAAGLVFTSGQIPQDPTTGKVHGDAGFREQALLVFGNLERALIAADATLEDVVAVTVYLDDIGDWAEVNGVFAEVFDSPYPTRAVVGAALEGFRVEASAIAVHRGGDR